MCMYVCMYVCIYVSMYLCIYVSMYLCIYVSMYLCIYVSMYLCIYVSMYLCIYVSMYLCIYVSMYLCIYGCMDVWMYGCMDVWMYGCMDVWMYGCRCMHVCMYACMHACMHVLWFLKPAYLDTAWRVTSPGLACQTAGGNFRSATAVPLGPRWGCTRLCECLRKRHLSAAQKPLCYWSHSCGLVDHIGWLEYLHHWGSGGPQNWIGFGPLVPRNFLGWERRVPTSVINLHW